MRSLPKGSKYVAAAAAAGLLIGIPSAGAAVHHFVTGKDVKNGSLTAADVKNGSLHAVDFDKKVQAALKARAQLGLPGASGAAGAQGATGVMGATWSAGRQGRSGPPGPPGPPG